MEALLNKNALIEMIYTALHNIQPNGMKADLEWLFRVVIVEEGAGCASDTRIEQLIYQCFLVFKVDVQRTGGNASLFGHHLHSDTRQPIRLYQVKGSPVNFIDLILVSGFHDTNLDEYLFS